MTIQNAFTMRSTGDDVFAKSTFLVIDDFPGMRTVLGGLLRSCGANGKMIDNASNGPEAIGMLSKKRYDIVLCDFNLGAGQNGMQVLEEARVKGLIGPGCCWIMVTAEKSTETVMGAAEEMPDAYLIKPITEATLMNRVQKIKAKKESFADIDRAMAAKDFQKAIRLCDERLGVDKANVIELLRLKCNLLALAGQLDKAKQSYETILAKATHDVPWAQIGLARVHMRTGDHEAACELLEQVVDRNRSFLEAYDCLAECYQAMDEDGKAENILERAIALSPNSHSRQRALGQVALKAGKLDRAEEALRKSVTLSEHSVKKVPDTYFALARTVSQKANPQEALRLLDQVEKQFPNEEIKLKSKSIEGQVHLQNNNPKGAEQAALQLAGMLERSSVKVDSANTKEMAQLMLATGQRDKAVSLLKSEVMNNPEDKEHLASVRDIFLKAGMTDEGDTLVEETRREAVAMMNAGTLLAKDGKYEEAIDQMRQALEKMPRNVRLLFNTAHIMIAYMERAGSEPSMIREVRKYLSVGLQLAPGDARIATLTAKLEALAAA